MAQEKFKRKLATILIADVADYSRLMGEAERLLLRLWNSTKRPCPSLSDSTGADGSCPRGQSAKEVKMFNKLIGYPRNGQGF